MVNNHSIQRIIDHLRKPFVQRLIILIVSTLLAMSLGCMTMLTIQTAFMPEMVWFHIPKQSSLSVFANSDSDWWKHKEQNEDQATRQYTDASLLQRRWS